MFAARHVNVFHKDGRLEILKGCNFLTLGHQLPKEVLSGECRPFCTSFGSFSSTACFQKEEARANFSGKVESREAEGACVFNTDATIDYFSRQNLI